MFKMANKSRVVRLNPALEDEIRKDLEENQNLINSQVSQLRLAKIIHQTKQLFIVPKFIVDFELNKCHIKKNEV